MAIIFFLKNYFNLQFHYFSFLNIFLVYSLVFIPFFPIFCTLLNIIMGGHWALGNLFSRQENAFLCPPFLPPFS